MTGKRTLFAVILVACLVTGGLLGSALTMLIHTNAENQDSTHPSIKALELGYRATGALYSRDYAALSSMIGADGLRIVAFSTVASAGETVFTKEQVRDFADDTKTYIFGVDSSGSQVIERLPSEFIAEYLSAQNFAQAPQVAINRVLKTGNAAENVLEYYPAPEYTMVDFYYPPSEQGGLDWISLKIVVKTGDESFDLVALVRGVYTAQ